MSSNGKENDGTLAALSQRRAQTTEKLSALKSHLSEAEKIVDGKACVYATGSFGRCEAGPESDLDLFIVSQSLKAESGGDFSALSRLDTICLQANLIQLTRRLDFPEFSGDGEYLIRHTTNELVGTLGTRADDAENTFTARLLLLLESHPLVGCSTYGAITRDVIKAYWRDFADHERAFIPAFLANDILRLWRTFCVNYEARTERAPDEKKAKGKVRNYKLKHSRLLTCYSALLYLLATHKIHGTVTPDHAIDMIALTPTERIQYLIGRPEIASARAELQKLLARYDKFLQTTMDPDPTLASRFMDKDVARKYLDDAYDFGDLIFGALNIIGDGSRFHRLLVV